MSLKNYIVELDLKGLVPELANYLWTGETDYSKQKTTAQQIVLADFSNRGYQLRNLRPELYLDTTDPNDNEDIGNRFRAVAICTTVTGTAYVTISGTNDITGTYTTAGVSSNLASGTNTWLLTDYFKFYKYALTGTATLTDVYLVESANYDLLFAYKWLELILNDAIVEENDAYHIKAKEIGTKYNNLLSTFKPFYDIDEDGELTASEQQSNNIATIRH